MNTDAVIWGVLIHRVGDVLTVWYTGWISKYPFYFLLHCTIDSAVRGGRTIRLPLATSLATLMLIWVVPAEYVATSMI